MRIKNRPELLPGGVCLLRGIKKLNDVLGRNELGRFCRYLFCLANGIFRERFGDDQREVGSRKRPLDDFVWTESEDLSPFILVGECHDDGDVRTSAANCFKYALADRPESVFAPVRDDGAV